MYKLLLVDDEEEVRQGIRDKIDWNKFGFTVIGEAENGREALDLIEEKLPDIVLTDINMPFMDGLELTSQIRNNYPTVKVVILTGFDDFKFAQAAIKYGVSDYILKPVLPKDINDLLIKLKNQINLEIQEKEDIDKLQQHYTDSLPILKENFLVNLILGNPKLKTIKIKTDLFKIRIKGNYFAAAIVKIDRNSINANTIKGAGKELRIFAVLNIIREILENHQMCEAFFHEETIVVISGMKCSDKMTARNKLFFILEEIRQTIKKYLKITVTIGLGGIHDSPQEIRESYKSAKTALEYKIILSGDKIIFVEDLEPDIKNFFLLSEEKETALISSIKFGNKESVSESVELLFNDIADTGASIKEYQLYFMEIIAALLKLARLFGIDPSNVLPNDTDMYVELSKFNSLEHAKNWIIDLSLNLMKRIAGKRRNGTQILFEKAKDYVLKNYGDHELNIQKLADYLYISPSYLRLIFKKEEKETFLKFLMRIRLDKAKELLKDRNVKIAEVAEKVGYPDVSYFSYFFKKNIGKSPREYKKCQ